MKREENDDIKSVIKNEEENFFNLLKEKEPLLIKLKDNLTGEILSWLHHTHGIDPDLVEDILCIKLSFNQQNEYKEYYNIHRETGLKGFKPKMIYAKT